MSLLRARLPSILRPLRGVCPARHGAAGGAQLSRRCTFAASAFRPSAGPDVPQAEDVSRGLPPWPAGWHDHLQYHFFFEGLFVQARVFLTPSLEEHSLWIYDHSVGKVEELVNSSEPLRQDEGGHLSITSSRLHLN